MAYTITAAFAAKAAWETSKMYKFMPEAFIGLLATVTTKPEYGKLRCDSDETGDLLSGGDVVIYVVAVFEGQLVIREIASESGTLREGGGGYFLSEDSSFPEAIFM